MKKTVNTLLAGAVALTMAGAATDAYAAKDKEKCYGVVKAGMNGCGSADGKHSCAGQGTEDASVQEWLYLPTGICEKLATGTTTPGGDHAAADDHGAADDHATKAVDAVKDHAVDAVKDHNAKH